MKFICVFFLFAAASELRGEAAGERHGGAERHPGKCCRVAAVWVKINQRNLKERGNKSINLPLN